MNRHRNLLGETRFRFGLAVTICWLLLALGFALFRWNAMQNLEPNELADFFSGCFAPLAFLWLVIGYLQQGQELALSTQALQLQAEELRSSVEQQRELVEVTRAQVESDRQALTQARYQQKWNAQARFIVTCGGSFSTGRVQYQFDLLNVGHTATQVSATLDIRATGRRHILSRAIFVGNSRETGGFTLAQAVPAGESGSLTVTYVDGLGESGVCEFVVQMDSTEPNAVFTVTQVMRPLLQQ